MTTENGMKLELPLVRALKKSGVLAEILREKILSEELREGDSLPSEKEMVESTGISRASVREAISLLEAEGLVRTRPGRNGGATVHKPDAQIMVRPIELLIRGRKLPFHSIIETREALEPAGAQLAALYRTDGDLEKLDALCELLESDIENVKSYLDVNMKWHMAVMQASHNELMIGFIHALSNIIYSATDIEEFNSLESRWAVARVHRKVVEAIRARDVDAARRRMERHVQAYSQAVAPHAPSKIAIE